MEPTKDQSEQPSQAASSVVLSICIPTYNRCALLEMCLESISAAARDFSSQTEVVVVDNASTDNTQAFCRGLDLGATECRYYRNSENIGAARNLYECAKRARGQFIWLVGDDDLLDLAAVSRILSAINEGYRLIICEYSVWTKDLATQIRARAIKAPGTAGEIRDHNQLLSTFGLHLGYISSVVVHRDIVFGEASTGHEKHLEGGFAFMYTIYAGVKANCAATFLGEPVIRYRSDNTTGYDALRYFVQGACEVFADLERLGYSSRSTKRAKHDSLRHWVLPLVRHFTTVDQRTRSDVFRVLFRYHLFDRTLWLRLVPVLLMPEWFIRLGVSLRRSLVGFVSGDE